MKKLTLREAQRIAESIVGSCSWDGAMAIISCPGKHLHTKANGPRDCKVVCEKINGLPPIINCYHTSCKGLLEDLNLKLRSTLGRASQRTRRSGGQSIGDAPAPSFPRVPLPRLKRSEPEFDPNKLERLARKLPGVDANWFAARSPIPPDTQTPESFLYALYRDGEKVLVFNNMRSPGQELWTPLHFRVNEAVLDRFKKGAKEGVWFLCNPVNGKMVINDSGTLSARSHQNITSWRYMVVESDEADKAQWMSALAQLPLPIASICESGGISIHALVRLDAVNKQDWDSKAAELKPMLVMLGADPKAISAIRLTRLACCERLGTTNGDGYVQYREPRMQRLLYLNGNPDNTPICKLLVNPDLQARRRPMGEVALEIRRAR